jgi:regulatory protein YycI of two-component signal transduction system YycFG
MFFRRKRQEKEIEEIKQDFHNRINTDISIQKQINKKLANGITLRVFTATGGHK